MSDIQTHVVEVAKNDLRSRGFRMTRSGAYDLTRALPVQAFLEKERFPQRGHPARVTWRLFFGGPGAALVRGVIEPVVYMFSQGEQRAESLSYYPLETDDEQSVFVEDYARFTLAAVDENRDAQKLTEHLLSGALVPFGGRVRSRVPMARDVLSVASAFELPDDVEIALSILRQESEVSPERNDAAIRVAARFGLSLGPR
jgi:hypothetical protein